MYQSQDKFQIYKLDQTCEWISKLLKVTVKYNYAQNTVRIPMANGENLV